MLLTLLATRSVLTACTQMSSAAIFAQLKTFEKKKHLNFCTLDDLMVDMDVFGIQKALRKARSPAGPDLPSCVLPSLTELCQINQKHF